MHQEMNRGHNKRDPPPTPSLCRSGSLTSVCRLERGPESLLQSTALVPRAPDPKSQRRQLCWGKRETAGRINSSGILPASRSAGAVLEAGPLHLGCQVHRQGIAAFPDTVLEPIASEHRPAAPPGVQPGKSSGFVSLSLNPTDRLSPAVILRL